MTKEIKENTFQGIDNLCGKITALVSTKKISKKMGRELINLACSTFNLGANAYNPFESVLESADERYAFTWRFNRAADNIK